MKMRLFIGLGPIVTAAFLYGTDTPSYRDLWKMPSGTAAEYRLLANGAEEFLAGDELRVDQKSEVLELLRNRANGQQLWEEAAALQRRNVALPGLRAVRRLQQKLVLADILWRRLYRMKEAATIYGEIIEDPDATDEIRGSARVWHKLLTEVE